MRIELLHNISDFGYFLQPEREEISLMACKFNCKLLHSSYIIHFMLFFNLFHFYNPNGLLPKIDVVEDCNSKR